MSAEQDGPMSEPVVYPSDPAECRHLKTYTTAYGPSRCPDCGTVCTPSRQWLDERIAELEAELETER